ncbi:MAG: hypothetical protein FWE69_07390 [Clostridiales bacterium]|nr:hypothetical protein [Clostridiales bacterium]
MPKQTTDRFGSGLADIMPDPADLLFPVLAHSCRAGRGRVIAVLGQVLTSQKTVILSKAKDPKGAQ